MIPVVAIVGRPNVGKSTLFNRLVGESVAIVHDMPGVTRDRHYADAFLHGREITLIDTGGFDPTTDDPMGQGIARHVTSAVDEADLVICVLDGSLPPTEPDAQAVQLLRRSGKPVVYAANKVDGVGGLPDSTELYRLGIENIVPISALHGRGTANLAQAIVDRIPPLEDEEAPEALDVTARVALIGRPNAGKSSLLNQLAGGERSLVDHRPGTTRDPVDTLVEHDGKRFLVIDTAGIRRRPRVDPGIESVSVMRSIRAMSRAEVVVLVHDATEPLSEQDARLLGLCTDRGRAVLVALNKVDLLTAKQRKAAEEQARDTLRFASWLQFIPISAKTGHGLPELMRNVALAGDEFRRRIPTGELNRFFEQVLVAHPPPTDGGHSPRVFYVTQAETAPPVFIAMCSSPEHLKDSYQRYMAAQIRKAFGISYVPVVIRFRKRSRKQDKDRWHPGRSG